MRATRSRCRSRPVPEAIRALLRELIAVDPQPPPLEEIMLHSGIDPLKNDHLGTLDSLGVVRPATAPCTRKKHMESSKLSSSTAWGENGGLRDGH
jgi:hypothetical protein